MYCVVMNVLRALEDVRTVGMLMEGGEGEGRDGMRRDDNESRGMFGFGDWGVVGRVKGGQLSQGLGIRLG